LRIEPRLWREFPDHHAYTRADVDDLRRWAAGLPPEGVVVTTQKDAVKLRLTELAGRELWSLRIGMAWQAGADRDRLESRLDELAAQARAVADAGTA
jgi:tetraacyldisaccharide 4'-kinase